MNWERAEVAKKSFSEVVIGLAFTRSWGIADSISRKVDIFSLTVLSILRRPILNWFSTSSPTDLTLLLPRWSMSSTSPLPSLRSSINWIIAKISSLWRTVSLISVVKFSLAFNLTLPTSDKSYRSLLKYRFENICSATSIVGASPGLKIL